MARFADVVLVEKAGSGELGASRATREPTEDKAVLLGRFLQLYAQLEPYMLPARRHSPRFPEDRLEDLDSQQRMLLAQFNEMFYEELSALRQTRNAAVHEPHLISAATVEGAIENRRELLRILRARLDMESRPG